MSSQDRYFPGKLRLMLDSVEEKGLSHGASWVHQGKAFQIHDTDVFMKEIAPMFFTKISRIRSFYRQLSIWGFSRSFPGSRGVGVMWVHNFFIQDQPELHCHIKRVPVKSVRLDRPNPIKNNDGLVKGTHCMRNDRTHEQHRFVAPKVRGSERYDLQQPSRVWRERTSTQVKHPSTKTREDYTEKGGHFMKKTFLHDKKKCIPQNLPVHLGGMIIAEDSRTCIRNMPQSYTRKQYFQHMLLQGKIEKIQLCGDNKMRKDNAAEARLLSWRPSSLEHAVESRKLSTQELKLLWPKSHVKSARHISLAKSPKPLPEQVFTTNFSEEENACSLPRNKKVSFAMDFDDISRLRSTGDKGVFLNEQHENESLSMSSAEQQGGKPLQMNGDAPQSPKSKLPRFFLVDHKLPDNFLASLKEGLGEMPCFPLKTNSSSVINENEKLVDNKIDETRDCLPSEITITNEELHEIKNECDELMRLQGLLKQNVTSESLDFDYRNKREPGVFTKMIADACKNGTSITIPIAESEF